MQAPPGWRVGLGRAALLALGETSKGRRCTEVRPTQHDGRRRRALDQEGLGECEWRDTCGSDADFMRHDCAASCHACGASAHAPATPVRQGCSDDPAEGCRSREAARVSPQASPRPSRDLNDRACEDRACRICFMGAEGDPLVAPCACRGNSGWVHCSYVHEPRKEVLTYDRQNGYRHGLIDG